MEVFLYNSTVCRLCGEENDNGTLLYTSEENIENLNEIINTYLPIKVTDDGQLPRTICPGCTIQLEATVEFINLIINGQKVIRELHHREKEYKKSNYQDALDSVKTDNIIDVDTNKELYEDDHPVALQVAGLERPKRKRGRPPKKPKSPEELAQEAAARDEQLKAKKIENDELSGKRRRKTPTRFMGVVQGKELEKIFKEEGMSDGEVSDSLEKIDVETVPKTKSKVAEIIGHKEESGELVVVVKGKGRGRPKGRMRQTHERCGICGLEFSSVGRYMSHIAQHGPVLYQCTQCQETFSTRLLFNEHQEDLSHTGQNIIADGKVLDPLTTNIKDEVSISEKTEEEETDDKPVNTKLEVTESLPDSNPDSLENMVEINMPADTIDERIPSTSVDEKLALVDNKDNTESVIVEKSASTTTEEPITSTTENSPTVTIPKGKVKCNFCDKLFSSRQSKSLHTKATHYGERPYMCLECGARFGYPRSLALHKLSHTRAPRIRTSMQRYACDLCGKVLNHPSSVAYHKEAEHAGQRYVCNKCGKSFKHKQLLARHQVVHTQLRPFSCKMCSSSFKSKASLVNHQLLHAGVKKFACDLCNDKFAHKTSLTLHMRWHSGEKPYSCQICDKSFSQKGNLSEHERIHTGEKPYQCTLCPRRFTTSSQHRLHMQRHTADNRTADMVPKRFTTRGVIATYGRRNIAPAGANAGAGADAETSREHKCTVCSRGFPDRWSLVKHMRTHTGERPYKCPHCPRAFADNSNLNKHKRAMHKQMSLLHKVNKVPDDVTESWATTYTLRNNVEPEKLTIVETDDIDDRVIFVACDFADNRQPSYHVIDNQELEQLREEPEEEEITEQSPQNHQRLESVIVDARNHIPVTDEQGNPLHFTMQDGTRLAITSTDGKTLQVLTQDGQTIPVEINGYADHEEVHNPDTIVHQLDLNKSIDSTESTTSPVTHIYAIV